MIIDDINCPKKAGDEVHNAHHEDELVHQELNGFHASFFAL